MRERGEVGKEERGSVTGCHTHGPCLCVCGLHTTQPDLKPVGITQQLSGGRL